MSTAMMAPWLIYGSASEDDQTDRPTSVARPLLDQYKVSAGTIETSPVRLTAKSVSQEHPKPRCRVKQ